MMRTGGLSYVQLKHVQTLIWTVSFSHVCFSFLPTCKRDSQEKLERNGFYSTEWIDDPAGLKAYCGKAEER